MKIWLLYDNPYDDGDDVYGAFSTEEKANEAQEVLSEVARHELYVREIELDDLDKHLPRAKEGLCFFGGWKQRYDYGGGVSYGKWSISQNGLDSFFENSENSVSETKNGVYAHIKAKSVEEATEIAEKMLNEKKDGYSAWLE